MISNILFITFSKRDTDVSLDSVGEGKSGILWENDIETCILSYVKQIVIPGLMHETGGSGLVHWDDLRGGIGKEVGGGFRMGDTCALMPDSCKYMAKTTTIL